MADPMSILAGVATVAPFIGGILGQDAAAGDRAAANELWKRAYSQFDGINIPDEEKMRLALETLQSQGQLTPDLEQAIALGDTALTNINIDPRLRQAQMTALDTLSKMGAEGLTAEDRASLNAARRQVSGDEQARQAAILQNMAQRGTSGSGLELAAKLSSSQAAADRASQQSDNTMAMAQRRMLDAVSQAGSLGGQLRQQDYGEQANTAQARDAIAQFNAQQAASTQARNIAARNAAQATNLQDKQRIADANVAIHNAQQQYNKQLPQQTFQNTMKLAGSKSDALIGQGSVIRNQGDERADQIQDFARGFSQAGLGLYNKFGK